MTCQTLLWSVWTFWIGRTERALNGTLFVNMLYNLLGANISNDSLIWNGSLPYDSPGAEVGKLTVGKGSILFRPKFWFHTFEQGLYWSQPVSIGDHCSLGFRTVVLGGVSIDDCCLLAAGSVVVKNEVLRNPFAKRKLAKSCDKCGIERWCEEHYDFTETCGKPLAGFPHDEMSESRVGGTTEEEEKPLPAVRFSGFPAVEDSLRAARW